MGTLIQIILGVALLAVVITAIAVFAKALSQKSRRKTAMLFLLIELLLFTCSSCLILTIYGWPGSIEGFLIVALMLAFAANIPVLIVVKIAQTIRQKK